MAKVVVNVYLKSGVLDPQGKAIEHALDALEFKGVNSVRVGKQIVLDVEDCIDEDDVKQMCETLLANTVIEDYDIKFEQ